MNSLNFNNKIEILVNLFTFDNGELKVLLLKKNDEPYKGYWMLPSSLLMSNETVEELTDKIIYEMAGFKNIPTFNCSIFSDINRITETRIVGFSVIGIVDTIKSKLKQEPKDYEMEWFNINSIPKTIYDNGLIIKDASNLLKERLLNIKDLKKLFPSDFTIPELQKVYEQVLDKKLDRRNFRKKLLNLNIIEDTKEKNISMNGRPAKLYRFKEEIEDKELFSSINF